VDPSTGEGLIRATAFVAGCSGVATLAYLISFWIGLSTISALIASHEKLNETSRFLGAVIGIAIGIATSTSQFDATVSTQIAMGVALRAIVAREWPSLRVGKSSSSTSSHLRASASSTSIRPRSPLPQKVPEADRGSMTQKYRP
jgi:hypothetical protein